jgi:thiol:disulfide interchange protein DsbA
MNRRRFFLRFMTSGAAAGLALSIDTSRAQMAGGLAGGLGINTNLGPPTTAQGGAGGPPQKLFRLVDIPNASQTVYEIFEFGCPYCRKVNAEVEQWGRTLPHGWTFRQIPALVGPAFVPMSVIYLAVTEIDPNAVPAFMSRSFALVQDHHRPLSSYKTYITAASDVGISLARLKAAAMSSRNKKALFRARSIATGADIRVTPSLVIDGRFAIDPNNADGNYGLFFQLADGLISHAETDPLDQSVPSPAAAPGSITTAPGQ